MSKGKIISLIVVLVVLAGGAAGYLLGGEEFQGFMRMRMNRVFSSGMTANELYDEIADLHSKYNAEYGDVESYAGCEEGATDGYCYVTENQIFGEVDAVYLNSGHLVTRADAAYAVDSAFGLWKYVADDQSLPITTCYKDLDGKGSQYINTLGLLGIPSMKVKFDNDGWPTTKFYPLNDMTSGRLSSWLKNVEKFLDGNK